MDGGPTTFDGLYAANSGTQVDGVAGMDDDPGAVLVRAHDMKDRLRNPSAYTPPSSDEQRA